MWDFIGIDPGTNGDQCPAVWANPDAGEAGEIAVQGWLADEALHSVTQADSPLPDSEAVVRIPARMIPLIRQACDALERPHD